MAMEPFPKILEKRPDSGVCGRYLQNTADFDKDSLALFDRPAVSNSESTKGRKWESRFIRHMTGGSGTQSVSFPHQLALQSRQIL